MGVADCLAAIAAASSRTPVAAGNARGAGEPAVGDGRGAGDPAAAVGDGRRAGDPATADQVTVATNPATAATASVPATIRPRARPTSLRAVAAEPAACPAVSRRGGVS